MAISAAGTAASLAGQRQQQKAQLQQQQDLVAANNTVADEQIAQLRTRQAQEAESAAREGERARQAGQRTKASGVTAAGDAGVSGNSVDAVIGEYGMHLGQFRETLNRQTTMSGNATEGQIVATKMGTRFQNLQINAPVAGPNYAAATLNLASDGLGIYKAYNPNAFTPKPKTA